MIIRYLGGRGRARLIGRLRRRSRSMGGRGWSGLRRLRGCIRLWREWACLGCESGAIFGWIIYWREGRIRYPLSKRIYENTMT